MASLRVGYRRLGYLDENPAKPRTPSAKHDHGHSQSHRYRANARTRAHVHPGRMRIDAVVGASAQYCKTFPPRSPLPAEPQSFSTSGRIRIRGSRTKYAFLANTPPSFRPLRYPLTLSFPTRSFRPLSVPHIPPHYGTLVKLPVW